MKFTLFFHLPVWINGVLLLGLLLLALEVGYRIGMSQREKWRDVEDSGGNLVLTTVLALLGLIMAFTFGDGINHYKSRKQAVIGEANALGTAFMSADMVADPGRTEYKKALLDYSRMRAAKPGRIYDEEEVRKRLEQSSQVLDKLWPATLQILQQEPPGEIEAILVAATIDVFDIHTIRNAATFDTLPPIVWVMIIFITSSSMAVAGFNAGLLGRISRWRMLTLSLVLVGVVLVIQDFDRPLSGFIVVSHDSIHSVITMMETALVN